MSASDYIERVAGLPCIICYFKLNRKVYLGDVHHTGDADERDPWAITKLCHEHHQGSTGIHGLHRRPFYSFWKVSNNWLLARTNELLAKE